MTASSPFARRTLLKSLACATASRMCPPAFGQPATSLHQPLPPWQPGEFLIHHIDTGRGNSTLLVFPDATTLMIDAGAATGDPSAMSSAHPNDSRRPGEWLARYALAHAPAPRLDYFLATHVHPDHISGLADVQSALPIGTCIDRGFPAYAAAQQPLNAPFTQEYLALLRARTQQGHAVEAAQVGSTTQIRLANRPAAYTNFAARILSANGTVWDPASHSPRALLPAGAGNENLFSVAVRFSYGPFSYFTGGDLTCDTHDDHEPALDIESPVARAAGRTEVALADHHGYFDACGPAFTRSLAAQVYIIPSWDVGHPGSAQMQRMTGAWDNKATHDVFALDLHPANALINRRFAPQLKSQTGHVVVRVAPGGNTFTIYTLDSTVERGNINGVFGPYTSRATAAKDMQ